MQTNTGEKETRASDLEGFWEMIYFQVDDVHKKFVDLESRRERDWKEPEIVKKKRTTKGSKKVSNGTSNNEKKRKTDFKKFKAEMRAKMNLKPDEVKQSSMGFINVLTPMKKRKSVVVEDVQDSVILTSVRRSTRKRKSIVPELDFSKEPTYLLPISVFEDCVQTSASEWPITAAIKECVELDSNNSSPASIILNLNQSLQNNSPAGCLQKLSVLQLSSPLAFDTIKDEDSKSELELDLPFSRRYLTASTCTPVTEQAGTPDKNCNGLPTVTPRRSLRRRTCSLAPDLMVFSP